MLFLKLLVFAAFVAFFLRLSGRWSGPIRLPHWTPDLFSPGETAGHRSLASGSDSDSDRDSGRGESRGRDDESDEFEDDDEWDDESPTDPLVSDAVHVSKGSPRITVTVKDPEDDKPRLGEHLATRLERMSGRPRTTPRTSY